MEKEVLRMQDIACVKKGGAALFGGNLSLMRGEVMGLLGLDDSGCTEMVDILFRRLHADGGRIWLFEKEIAHASRQTPNELGIYRICSGTRLNENLSIAENLFVTTHSRHGPMLVNHQKINREAQEFIRYIGLSAAPNQPAGTLSPSQQHLVELMKARIENGRLIILDSMMEKYSQSEIEKFMEIVHRMARDGHSFLVKTTKIDNSLSHMDRITVMRGGATAKVLRREDIAGNQEKLQIYMVGRPSVLPSAQPPKGKREEVLSFSAAPKDGVSPLQFTVYAGETVGLIDYGGEDGISVVNAICGLEGGVKPCRITFSKRECVVSRPSDAVKHGVILVPEDVADNGIFQNIGVEENVSMAVLPKITNRLGWVNRRLEKYFIRAFYAAVEKDIAFALHGKKAGQLDNRTRYAVLFNEWRLMRPKLIVMVNPAAYEDELTRGYIHRKIKELNNEGIAFLVLIKNISEMERICSRCIVLRENTIRQDG